MKVSEEISHHAHYEPKDNDETMIIPVIEGRCSVSVMITPRPSELHCHNATRNAMRSALPKTDKFPNWRQDERQGQRTRRNSVQIDVLVRDLGHSEELLLTFNGVRGICAR